MIVYSANGKPPVESPFETAYQAAKYLNQFTQLSGFAVELRDKALRGDVSREQAYWLHRLAVEQGTRIQREANPIKLGENLEPIFGLFEKASRKLKFPSITLRTADGAEVVMKRAGARSRYAGQVFVTDGGRFGENRYYGRIGAEGFVAGRDWNPALEPLLREFAKNPAEVAAKHGRLTGHCCFCEKALTDARSLAVGYGSTCAKNYDLPWGSRTSEDTYPEHMELMVG